MKCPKCGKELEVVDDIGIPATTVIGLKCDDCEISMLLIGPTNPKFDYREGMKLCDYLRDLILDVGGQDDA